MWRGYSGDGGAATRAEINAPDGVAVDPQGTLYIADTFNFRVRKLSPLLPTFSNQDLLMASEDCPHSCKTAPPNLALMEI